MRIAIIGMVALAVLTAVGSVFKCALVPYMVFGTVCAITILITFGKVKSREYPIYIFGMSLALLWQTSMMGVYIVGTDIHGELFSANRAIAQGWDWQYADPSNTSVIIGWLAPLLDKFGFDTVWQFKALYPAMLASVPLILFFAYRKIMGEKRAYFAVLFFMIMPMFLIEVVGIVKSMVAEVFLALMVLFMALDLKHWQKALGIGFSVALASLCHYTIGTLAILYLIGSLVVLAVTKPMHLTWLKGRKMTFLQMGVVLVCALAVFYFWFNNVGQGIMMGYYQRFYIGIASMVTPTFASPPTITPPTSVAPPTSIPPASVTTPKAEIASPSYLYKQEPLVQVALGLDFVKASFLGKVFRVMQYLTQLFLASGFVYLLIRHRNYSFTPEFISCVVVSYGMLVLCLFFLSFSTLINASRFYQVSLFFLAPMLVVGVEGMASDIGRGIQWLKVHQSQLAF